MSLPNCKSPCGNCPFKKDTLQGWLGEKRIKEILGQKSFVCHKNNKLQCAGFMHIKGEKSEFVFLANKMGLDTGLKNRHLVFDTEEDCIKTHSL